ncbi:hypothetical protein FOL47_003662 [Perkinsus chesapeaki]|uniref:Peptidase A1 domain-containing protein n=1 Tax=Perkinsus chesapeaki TaxID=330153 RepID=A0A7J6M7Z4_PERCH|nr:hypothetical protein FOL47_003662 [Perkinsus chesapeaki]
MGAIPLHRRGTRKHVTELVRMGAQGAIGSSAPANCNEHGEGFSIPIKQVSDKYGSSLSTVTVRLNGQTLHPFLDTGASGTLIPHLESFGTDACKDYPYGCLSCEADSCAEGEKETVVYPGNCKGTFVTRIGSLEVGSASVLHFRYGLLVSWTKGCPMLFPCAIGLEAPLDSRSKKKDFLYQIVYGGIINNIVLSLDIASDSKAMIVGGGVGTPDVLFKTTEKGRWSTAITSCIASGNKKYFPIKVGSPPISVQFDMGSSYISGPLSPVKQIMDAIGDILGLRVGVGIYKYSPTKESTSYYVTDCSVLHLDDHKDTWIGFELDLPSKYTARVFLADLVTEYKKSCFFNLRSRGSLSEFDWTFGQPFFKAHKVRLYYETFVVGLTEHQ